MSWIVPLIAALFLPLAAQEADSPPPEQLNAEQAISARLVSSRPKLRPGEWCTLAWILESKPGNANQIGPPDDGIKPAPGMPQTDTRLQWISDDDDYALIPDLISIQWPRTSEAEGTPRGVLELPKTIFIPVKAGPGSIVGEATIRFALDGVLMNEAGTPFRIEDEVTVEIVHPTDPNATELEGVNPMVFVTWRGNLPDWSVQHTSPSKPRTGAPLVAWLVFAIPLTLAIAALTWAFATKRM
jgi:hypothetical protein